MKTFLNVKFNEKNIVKNLGALWDSNEKKWYITDRFDKNKFTKYLNTNDISYDNVLLEFKKELEANGLIIDDYPIMNGKIQRVSVIDDKANKKSGAYVGYLSNYPAGFIQNFKTGYKENWKYKINNYSYTNYSHKKLQTNPNEAIINKNKLLALQEKTADRLIKEYLESSFIKNTHNYLLNKGFKNLSISFKQDKFGNLLIPLFDINNKLWSLQRIYPNGDKVIGVIKTKEEKESNIEYSAKKNGCFNIVDYYSNNTNLNNLETIIKETNSINIAEGYATALTISMVIKEPTIMSVDAGNMINVVEAFKNKFGDNLQINIFADLDKNQVGLDKANAIKEKFNNINIFLPRLSNNDIENKLSDFNDVFVFKGIEELKKQINDIYHDKNKELNNKKIGSDKNTIKFSYKKLLYGFIINKNNNTNIKQELIID